MDNSPTSKENVGKSLNTISQDQNNPRTTALTRGNTSQKTATSTKSKRNKLQRSTETFSDHDDSTATPTGKSDIYLCLAKSNATVEEGTSNTSKENVMGGGFTTSPLTTQYFPDVQSTIENNDKINNLNHNQKPEQQATPKPNEPMHEKLLDNDGCDRNPPKEKTEKSQKKSHKESKFAEKLRKSFRRTEHKSLELKRQEKILDIGDSAGNAQERSGSLRPLTNQIRNSASIFSLTNLPGLGGHINPALLLDSPDESTPPEFAYRHLSSVATTNSSTSLESNICESPTTSISYWAWHINNNNMGADISTTSMTANQTINNQINRPCSAGRDEQAATATGIGKSGGGGGTVVKKPLQQQSSSKSDYDQQHPFFGTASRSCSTASESSTAAAKLTRLQNFLFKSSNESSRSIQGHSNEAFTASSQTSTSGEWENLCNFPSTSSTNPIITEDNTLDDLTAAAATITHANQEYSDKKESLSDSRNYYQYTLTSPNNPFLPEITARTYHSAYDEEDEDQIMEEEVLDANVTSVKYRIGTHSAQLPTPNYSRTGSQESTHSDYAGGHAVGSAPVGGIGHLSLEPSSSSPGKYKRKLFSLSTPTKLNSPLPTGQQQQQQSAKFTSESQRAGTLHQQQPSQRHYSSIFSPAPVSSSTTCNLVRSLNPFLPTATVTSSSPPQSTSSSKSLNKQQRIGPFKQKAITSPISIVPPSTAPLICGAGQSPRDINAKREEFLRATMQICLVVSPPSSRLQLKSKSLTHLDGLESELVCNHAKHSNAATTPITLVPSSAHPLSQKQSYKSLTSPKTPNSPLLLSANSKQTTASQHHLLDSDGGDSGKKLKAPDVRSLQPKLFSSSNNRTKRYTTNPETPSIYTQAPHPYSQASDTKSIPNNPSSPTCHALACITITTSVCCNSKMYSTHIGSAPCGSNSSSNSNKLHIISTRQQQQSHQHHEHFTTPKHSSSTFSCTTITIASFSPSTSCNKFQNPLATSSSSSSTYTTATANATFKPMSSSIISNTAATSSSPSTGSQHTLKSLAMPCNTCTASLLDNNVSSSTLSFNSGDIKMYGGAVGLCSTSISSSTSLFMASSSSALQQRQANSNSGGGSVVGCITPSSAGSHLKNKSSFLLLQQQQQHQKRKKPILTRSEVSSSEYFSVSFCTEGGCQEEEFFPAPKGVTLANALSQALRRRNLSFNQLTITDTNDNNPMPPTYLEAGSSPARNSLDENTEVENLAGHHLIITDREESRKTLQKAASFGSRTRPPRLLSSASTDESTEVNLSGKQIKQRWSGLFGVKNPQQSQLCELLNNYSKNGVPQKSPATLNFDHPDLYAAIHYLDNMHKSWIDIVESSEMSDSEVRIQTAIWELVTTEVDYIHCLQTVTDLFLACLEAVQEEGLLREVDQHRLFANIRDICEANLKFWTHYLYPMVSHSVQNREPLRTAFFQQGFITFATIFSPYKKYCAEQSSCQYYCKELNRTNSLFTSYLAWCESQKMCNRLRLADILVRPMQRLTKYGLLLAAIKKHLNDVDEIEAIDTMLQTTENFVFSVNNHLTTRQENERLKGVMARIESYDVVDTNNEQLDKLIKQHSQMFDLCAPMKGCAPHHVRHLFMEGDHKYKDNLGKADVHCFLLTDILLVCKSIAKKGLGTLKVIRQPYLTDRLIVQHSHNILSCVYLNEFQVAVSAFTLQCSEAKNWYEALKRTKLIYTRLKQSSLTTWDSMRFSGGGGGGSSGGGGGMGSYIGGIGGGGSIASAGTVDSLGIKKSPMNSSICSHVTSANNSHSGSVEWNDSRNISVDFEKTNSLSSDEGCTYLGAHGFPLKSKPITTISPQKLKVIPTSSNMLTVQPLSHLGQSLPNLNLHNSHTNLCHTYSNNTLLVPGTANTATHSGTLLLSPCHRGISYPPPSPTRVPLRRGMAFSNSIKNPPLLKSRNITSQNSISWHPAPLAAGLSSPQTQSIVSSKQQQQTATIRTAPISTSSTNLELLQEQQHQENDSNNAQYFKQLSSNSTETDV